MSGLGDAEEAHVLVPGRYACGITLNGNVENERPSVFRVQFTGPDPISAPLVSWSQPSWQTMVDFVLLAREGSKDGQVIVRVTAAPQGRWTLQCRSQGEVVASTRSVTVVQVANVTSEGKQLPGLSTVSGTGSSFGAVLLDPDYEYACSIRIEANFDAAGAPLPFSVLLNDVEIASDTAADWQGDYRYSKESKDSEDSPEDTDDDSTTAGMSRNAVGVKVTASEPAQWSVSCVPKLS